MTTTRQFSQRHGGKLSKHTGLGKGVRQIIPNSGMQTAMNSVPGLQGRPPVDDHDGHTIALDPIEETTPDLQQQIEEAIEESTPLCRTTKSGAPNRQDLKREMRKRGFIWSEDDGTSTIGNGVPGWVRS